MKKHAARHHHRHVTHHKASKSKRGEDNYLVFVRGWMVVVMFALMLGVGAIVGSFLNSQMNAATPAVAGFQTEAK